MTINLDFMYDLLKRPRAKMLQASTYSTITYQSPTYAVRCFRAASAGLTKHIGVVIYVVIIRGICVDAVNVSTSLRLHTEVRT